MSDWRCPRGAPAQARARWAGNKQKMPRISQLGCPACFVYFVFVHLCLQGRGRRPPGRAAMAARVHHDATGQRSTPPGGLATGLATRGAMISTTPVNEITLCCRTMAPPGKKLPQYTAAVIGKDALLPHPTRAPQVEWLSLELPPGVRVRDPGPGSAAACSPALWRAAGGCAGCRSCCLSALHLGAVARSNAQCAALWALRNS